MRRDKLTQKHADEKFCKGIFFFLLFIILFIITIGFLDVNNRNKESILDKIKKEDNKLRKLEKKKSLKLKEINELKEREMKVMMIIRIVLVFLWLSTNSLLMILKIVEEINNLILYNNGILFLLFIILFAYKGNISSLRDLNKYFHKVLEGVIYRKNLYQLHTNVVEIEKKILKTEVKRQSLNTKLQ